MTTRWLGPLMPAKPPLAWPIEDFHDGVLSCCLFVSSVLVELVPTMIGALSEPLLSIPPQFPTRLGRQQQERTLK